MSKSKTEGMFDRGIENEVNATLKNIRNDGGNSVGSEVEAPTEKHHVVMRVAASDELGIESDICAFVYSLNCSIRRHFLNVIEREITSAFLVSGSLKNIVAIEAQAALFGIVNGFQVSCKRTNTVAPPRYKPFAIDGIASDGIAIWMRALDVQGLLWRTCSTMRENGINIISHSGDQHLIAPGANPEDEKKVEYIQRIVIVPSEGANRHGLLRALQQMEKTDRLLYPHEQLAKALGTPSVQFERDVFDCSFASPYHI